MEALVDTFVAVSLKETTTPTARPDYGKIYTKSDNIMYFQDGAGIEHAIGVLDTNYGGAYIFNNSTPTVIETANTPIALREFLSNNVQGFVFDAGLTGAITAYADYSGTVAGTVLATCNSHGLVTGDIITIRGTTNYNGIFQVTRINGNTFYFTDTWVADDGASDFDKGASLTAGVGVAGKYVAAWQMSSSCAGTQSIIFKMNVNVTQQDTTTAERKYPINDIGSCSSSGILVIEDGDIVWLSAQADGTSDLTNKHGNFTLHRL